MALHLTLSAIRTLFQPVLATAKTITNAVSGLAAAKTVTGATNATPIVITATGHGYSTGDRVKVASVGGNTNANGFWTITKVNDNSFSLDNSAGNSAYTSGGTAQKVDTTVTLTATGHGLSVGDLVVIKNVGGNVAANGLFQVQSAADADTFTVTALSVNDAGAYTSGGAALKATAGVVGKLKPYEIEALADALTRVSHVRSADKDAGSGESALDVIFAAAGNNP